MSIYKDCDIRGVYGTELNRETAYKIGRAIGSMMTGKKLAVGGDVRISTPEIKHHLMNGLAESGAVLVDLGILPTPAFYFALRHLALEGGVMVTASHNPAQYNGFKLMLGQTPVRAEVIREIQRRVQGELFTTVDTLPPVREENVLPEYERQLCAGFPAGNLRVVIDSGNGSMSETAPQVFRRLGYPVVPLFCSFDGSFPNRDPNPAVYKNLTALCLTVIENHADLGMAFDGDGDRVVFVDNKGRVISSERSLVLLIRACLIHQSGSVVYDQKSSTIVKKAILEMHGQPIMERSGHTFIKTRFLEEQSLLAGEVSGHFFFRELGYDDGLYAALTVARLIAGQGLPLANLVDQIPTPLITPDIRIPCIYEHQDEWLDRVRQLGRQYPLNEMDGVRVEFPDGWLLVRKSVTEAAVTVRIEADDEEAMQKITGQLLAQLPELRDYLA